MDQLRRRIPFVSSEETEEDLHILDEQEQDELIQDLRRENIKSNRRYLLLLRILIGLSALLQLIFLLGPRSVNPLQALFPGHPNEDTSIPLAAFFTLLSLLLHGMELLMFPMAMPPLPYRIAYPLAAVAPTLAICLQRPWPTLAWWSLTVVILFVTQSVHQTIIQGTEMISELETRKYTAPGA